MATDVEPDFPGKLRQGSSRLGAIEQNRKLVPADTRHARRGRVVKAVLKATSDLNQQLITDSETVFLVDPAQSFDVDEDDPVPITLPVDTASSIDAGLDGHEFVNRREPRLPVTREQTPALPRCHAGR
jgi:hypothetical protein